MLNLTVPCKSILIVEDDEAIRSSLNDVISSEGYPVYESSNGKQALESLNDIPGPCLILLDLMMPVMNGYDFTEVVKKKNYSDSFPIIVMSASREGEEFSKHNGYPFLKKPLDVDVLLKLIGKHFS